MKDVELGKVESCAFEPCPDCPWRVSNRGRRSKHKVEGEKYGWFTQRNRDRLWAGMRRGEAMTCHPTDPRHPGSPEDAKTKECAGALILQQRELVVLDRLMKAGDDSSQTLRRYKKLRPGGLTRDGLAILAWNAQFGAVPLMGGREMGRPNLNAEVEVAPGKLPWPPEGIEL